MIPPAARERFQRAHHHRRNSTLYWVGQLCATSDPAERLAILTELLDRMEIEIAGAWAAQERDRAVRLEGQCEAFAVWREAELAALAPETRHG